MERAYPYDRRGRLEPFLQDTTNFLTIHEIPNTAEAMMQIPEMEENPALQRDLIDNDALREWRESAIKQEHLGRSEVDICLVYCTVLRGPSHPIYPLIAFIGHLDMLLPKRVPSLETHHWLISP